MSILNSVLELALTAAPWLLIGLTLAALIKAWFPEHLLQRWLGGSGLGSITRGALIGTPLPLCSCGAIPVALTLHRNGASRGPTTAFLIGTPGVGADSLALTYALLGPFMLVARMLGAIGSAIVTGLLVTVTGTRQQIPEPSDISGCCSGPGHTHEATADVAANPAHIDTLKAGFRYAFGDLLRDIRNWLVAGIVLAGVLMALVSPEMLSDLGSGLLPKILMAVVGLPLYICAAAATPIALGLLVAGLSPGTVLVFLLAAPITSLATLTVYRREMGTPAVLLYLGGVLVCAVAAGWLTDLAIARTGIALQAQLSQGGELLPEFVEWPALLILLAAAWWPAKAANKYTGSASPPS
ncbi:SO_0444 family Cu/Zn efflux transporter [Aquisalimonas asiatica]|uniref:Permease n=1 Tax=Aquisalimonas asiatica TaxID=406100 RepID=A0A1H8TDL2_9GAMM|nr:SO_0444 family Cu/Zn efflux transporter [Aquisalimonas asiatica]SEO89189.1 hypothetical protein SAMN04488052_104101 [Aquisalimonas asiatica]